MNPKSGKNEQVFATLLHVNRTEMFRSKTRKTYFPTAWISSFAHVIFISGSISFIYSPTHCCFW